MFMKVWGFASQPFDIKNGQKRARVFHYVDSFSPLP